MATTTGLDVRNFINGKEAAPLEGQTEPIINPATEQEIGRTPLSTAGDVDAAVLAAQRAFPKWRDTTPADRSLALLRLADAIERNGEEFAQLESLNVGKPIEASREEIPFDVDNLRFFAGAIRSMRDQTSGNYMDGYTSIIQREPLGVVGQIAPWNYPLMMAIWKIGPALAAGNTVVLKPSEQTPLTAWRLAQLAAEFLPDGVLNIVFGHGEPAGVALVEHPLVSMVSLTGDVSTGKAVARAASNSLKKVHLELGGKAPVVVFDDADIEAVVAAVKVAGFINAGQDCTAGTRILASEKIHDDLVAALSEAAKSLKVGDPLSEETELGPLITGRHRERVQGFFERAPQHSQIVTGGGTRSGAGFYFEPTVVTQLKQNDEMIQREIFGPVLTVQRFSSDEEAVSFANGVPYGLAASIWTNDIGRSLKVSRQLQFGCVWVNDHLPIVSEMPHGGYKQSGYGKDLSVYALEDYTQIKHIMINVGE